MTCEDLVGGEYDQIMLCDILKELIKLRDNERKEGERKERWMDDE